jgi:NitT/TauT family transport system permease protein
MAATRSRKVAAARPASPTPRPGPLPLPLRIAVPLALGIAFVAAWEGLVRYLAIPRFILPAPSLIATSLFDDFGTLMLSAWVTLKITIAAFSIALVLGTLIAVLFAQSRLFEVSLFPYAVILQVTPIVSIAPLVLIWVGLDHLERALLILATIVAFFPILSNATLGLKSVDHNLHNLFDLYGATRRQRLASLQFPSALPYLLGGMRISGGLALIGAVVAEFVAGSGTGTGLAWRIIEAANRLNIPRMFAALLLMSALGILIFFSLSALEYFLLHRWHESAAAREN